MSDRNPNRIEPLLVGSAELARLLSVSKRTVERLQTEGCLPECVRIGKTGVRWRLADIREWVDQLDRTT